MFSTKKKIVALALVIGMSLSQGVWAAPSAPHGIKGLMKTRHIPAVPV